MTTDNRYLTLLSYFYYNVLSFGRVDVPARSFSMSRTCPKDRGELSLHWLKRRTLTDCVKPCIIISEVLNGSSWRQTDMCQGRFEPVLLSARQTALTCLPRTENERRLSGCHLSSESPSELIRVTARASNFRLCSTWTESFHKTNDTKRSLRIRKKNPQIHLAPMLTNQTFYVSLLLLITMEKTIIAFTTKRNFQLLSGKRMSDCQFGKITEIVCHTFPNPTSERCGGSVG